MALDWCVVVWKAAFWRWKVLGNASESHRSHRRAEQRSATLRVAGDTKYCASGGDRRDANARTDEHHGLVVVGGVVVQY
jgi:hypothetical protein